MNVPKAETPALIERRRHHDFQLQSELLRLIDSAQVPQIQALIIRQNGCENDAKTIKTLVSFLFFSVVNSQCSKPGLSPNEYAKLTDDIYQRLPPELRDWSCPTSLTGPPNKGKELFRHLIQRCAHAYLKESDTEGTITIPYEDAVYNSYGLNADKATTLRSLKDEGKFLLVEFVGQLVGMKHLPALIVYEYSLALIRSTSAPNPTQSDLEAICRLLRIAGQFTASQSWSVTVFNALELVEHRDREQLNKSLHLLLLVFYSLHLKFISLGDALDW